MPIPTGSFLQKFLRDPSKTDMFGTGLGLREAMARKRADETLEPFGQNAMDRLATIGSTEKNAKDLTKLNGDKRFDTGELSQGAQQLAQKVNENKKTSILQRISDFLNRGPFPGSPDDPRTPSGSKLIMGPDGQMYDENFIKTIPGGFSNMLEIERRKNIFKGMP